jgi:polyisoprenoid-binding protein YceI
MASDPATLAASPAAEPTDAAPRPWQVLAGGTLGFTATMNGSDIAGQFEDWSADIDFDPDALAQSRLVVRVSLGSARTGDAQRDQMLSGPDFFGSAGPAAFFRSTRIRKQGAERFSAAGTLTMNGKSRPVTLAFNLRIAGDKATVTGSTRLDRTAFGIGSGEWAAADRIATEVAVSFRFSARRTD